MNNISARAKYLRRKDRLLAVYYKPGPDIKNVKDSRKVQFSGQKEKGERRTASRADTLAPPPFPLPLPSRSLAVFLSLSPNSGVGAGVGVLPEIFGVCVPPAS